MAQTIKKVTVVGGTGNLGVYLVPALTKAGFTVTVLSRSASTTIPSLANIPIVQTDYTLTSLTNAFQGQDAVICATPATNVEDQKTIIDAAVAAKVTRILPNEFGTDTQSDEAVKLFPLFKAKRDVAAYLKEKEDAISWTGLCTGLWVDWCLIEGNLLGFDVKTKSGTLFDSGEAKFTASTINKATQAVASVLLHPEETKNKYVYVSSFDLNQNAILESLERVSGSKFSMDKSKAEDLLATGKKHLEEGQWDKAYYELVTALTYSGFEFGVFSEKTKYWDEVLGLEQNETMDDAAKWVLARKG